MHSVNSVNSTQYKHSPNAALNVSNLDNLKILFWNCNGLSESKFIFLQSIYKSFSIICVCESWLKVNAPFKFSLPGFKHFVSSREILSKRAKRGSGGVVIYVRETVHRLVSVEPTAKDEDRIWLRIVNGDELPIFLGVWYIPPKGTTGYYGIKDRWDLLSQEVARFKARGSILLLGDFNARTGVFPPPRLSNDSTINDFGKRLLDICEEHSLLILNGNIGNSSDYTCISAQGSSVVDYAIVSYNGPLVTHFSVGDLSPVSDHCHLECILPILKKASVLDESVSLFRDLEERCNMKYQREKRRVAYYLRWDEGKTSELAEALICSTWRYGTLERLKGLVDTNEKINLFQQSLINLAVETGSFVKRVLKPNGDKGKRNRHNQPWFDKQCLEKKRAWRKTLRSWKNNPVKAKLEIMVAAKKEYKRVCVNARKVFLMLSLVCSCLTYEKAPEKSFGELLNNTTQEVKSLKYQIVSQLMNGTNIFVRYMKLLKSRLDVLLIPKTC